VRPAHRRQVMNVQDILDIYAASDIPRALGAWSLSRDVYDQIAALGGGGPTPPDRGPMLGVFLFDYPIQIVDGEGVLELRPVP